MVFPWELDIPCWRLVIDFFQRRSPLPFDFAQGRPRANLANPPMADTSRPGGASPNQDALLKIDD